MRTIKELARESLAVQDACNLSGVALGFGRAAIDLREALGAAGERADTPTVNGHPIMILWADKIAHLTGTQAIGDDRVMRAYSEVHDLAGDRVRRLARGDDETSHYRAGE